MQTDIPVLYINQMLNWNNTDMRIIRISGDLVALYPIPKSKNSCSIKLVTENFADLTHAIQTGAAYQIEDPYFQLRATIPSGITKNKAHERYEKIKSLIEDEEIIFNEKKRLNAIDVLSDGNHKEKMTLYRILSIWWRKGQSLGALTPEYGKNAGINHNCRIKAGRKSNATFDVVPIDEEIREIFDEICRKYLLKGDNRVSLTDAHERAMNVYLQRHPEKNKSQAPSYSQLKHYYYKNFSVKERAKGRSNKIHYDKDIRGLHGSVYDVARGPGHIAEIDSTTLDVFIVRESDRSKVIASRPTMYVVTDVYSGMITGVSLSLDPAQYSSAADALYISMTSKETLCAKYAVELQKNEWPCQGIPEIIVADNGELSSEQIERFSAIYGVSISNTVSYRADQKSQVERSHALLMNKIKEFITAYPSTVSLHKQGYKDNRDMAELTLDECTKLIILATLCANRRIKEKLPDDYPSEGEPIPISLWNFGMNNGKSRLRMVNNYEQLQLSLLKRINVTITQDGIRGDNIYWICNEIVHKGLLERKQKDKKPQDMELAIDPADVSTAFLFPEPKSSPFVYWKCSLAPVSSRLKGMSLYEAKRFMAVASNVRAVADRKRQEYEAEKKSQMQKTVDNAHKAKPATSKSKAEVIKEAKKNAVDERIAQTRKHRRIQEEVDATNATTDSYKRMNQSANKIESDNDEFDGSFPDDVNLISD